VLCDVRCSVCSSRQLSQTSICFFSTGSSSFPHTIHSLTAHHISVVTWVFLFSLFLFLVSLLPKGKIGCAICWDQWFPETARTLVLMGAELLLYPTAIGSEPPPAPPIDSSGAWMRTMQVMTTQPTTRIHGPYFDRYSDADHHSGQGLAQSTVIQAKLNVTVCLMVTLVSCLLQLKY
jgi:hypothetical protein